MRIGQNPEKLNTALRSASMHRIIIPVFIPNLTDSYFKDGLDILKLCIGSLIKTIHSKTRISIINNGCCEAVSLYLKNIYDNEAYVDQLLHSKTNLGKINALYSAIKSNIEPIITITDADVMFLPHWQNATETLLNDFPEAGMVSPVPSSLGHTSTFIKSTIYFGFFRGRIQFSEVQNPEALLNFQRSIDRVMYNEHHLKSYLTIANKKNKAVIGCGHFVATFRAEVFEYAPSSVCKDKISGTSDNNYIDFPVDDNGFLRLATLDNYAYHLGNVKEGWMERMLDTISVEEKSEPLATLSMMKPLKKHQYFIGKLMHRILLVKFKKQFFKFKGLSKAAAEAF